MDDVLDVLLEFAFQCAAVIRESLRVALLSSGISADGREASFSDLLQFARARNPRVSETMLASHFDDLLSKPKPLTGLRSLCATRAATALWSIEAFDHRRRP